MQEGMLALMQMGKTTAALLLASELTSRGADVTIIDADPERWLTQWSRLPGRPERLRIESDVTEESIVDLIEAAQETSQFVIVDLEGTASLMVANAVGMSDLVVIPTQGGAMDAKGAAKMIRLIRNQERLARRGIPHGVTSRRWKRRFAASQDRTSCDSSAARVAASASSSNAAVRFGAAWRSASTSSAARISATSRTSARPKDATRTPRRGVLTASPCASRRRNASRTGTWLAPNSAATPPRWRQVWIASLISPRIFRANRRCSTPASAPNASPC